MALTYSTAPIQQVLHQRAADRGLAVTEMADVVRLPRRTLVRALSQPRLRWDVADRCAIALGYHPVELWPSWHDDTQPKR